jgi:DNA primase
MSVEADIAAIARRYLHNVKPSGPENLMATCPFHTRPDGSPERTPSFAISVVTGLYFCHSCKARGNLRQFLKAMGVTPFAMRNQYSYLLEAASKATPAPRNPTKMRPATDSEPLPESFLGLFDRCPLDLVSEGFSEEVLQEFDVGFDEKHLRITFPLRNLTGQLVGISGRDVTDRSPRRYKVYDKEYEEWGLPARKTEMSEIIWNIDRVYPDVYFGVGVPLVVVEGFKACMWVYQAGIKNVVALCGSYLKDGQQWLLEHLGGVVYVMMDNDDSGQSGAHEIGAALSQSLKVRMVTFRSSAKQPTDLDPQEVVQAIDQAEEYYLWAIKNGLSPTRRRSEYGIR